MDLDDGYESQVLELRQGQILFMSAWLVHRTFVNPACPPADFKLALSQRFDDLEDRHWQNRGFVSAYHTAVDETYGLNSPQVSVMIPAKVTMPITLRLGLNCGN